MHERERIELYERLARLEEQVADLDDRARTLLRIAWSTVGIVVLTAIVAFWIGS